MIREKRQGVIVTNLVGIGTMSALNRNVNIVWMQYPFHLLRLVRVVKLTHSSHNLVPVRFETHYSLNEDLVVMYFVIVHPPEVELVQKG